MANNTEQEIDKIINNLRGYVNDDELDLTDDGDKSWLYSVNKSFSSAEEKIKSLIEAEATRREQALLDDLKQYIDHKIPVTNVQNINPLSNGLYVKTANLYDILEQLKRNLQEGDKA